MFKATASQAAKAAGFINLKQVQEISGESQQTLCNWFNKEPLRFEIILLGCKVKLDKTQAVENE